MEVLDDSATCSRVTTSPLSSTVSLMHVQTIIVTMEVTLFHHNDTEMTCVCTAVLLYLVVQIVALSCCSWDTLNLCTLTTFELNSTWIVGCGPVVFLMSLLPTFLLFF